MRRSIFKYMRCTDILNCLFHGHSPAVYVFCPYIADPLLTFQIILRNLLHCDCCVFKMFYLSKVRSSVLKSGVENNEDQYSDHDDHVDNDDISLFHAPVLRKAKLDHRNPIVRNTGIYNILYNMRTYSAHKFSLFTATYHLSVRPCSHPSFL